MSSLFYAFFRTIPACMRFHYLTESTCHRPAFIRRDKSSNGRVVFLVVRKMRIKAALPLQLLNGHPLIDHDLIAFEIGAIRIVHKRNQIVTNLLKLDDPVPLGVRIGQGWGCRRLDVISVVNRPRYMKQRDTHMAEYRPRNRHVKRKKKPLTAETVKG